MGYNHPDEIWREKSVETCQFKYKFSYLFNEYVISDTNDLPEIDCLLRQRRKRRATSPSTSFAKKRRTVDVADDIISLADFSDTTESESDLDIERQNKREAQSGFRY